MSKTKKYTSLVAHVTVRGLESLKRGRIDFSDPRLNGEPGTIQLELHAGRRTARQLEHEIKAARTLLGDEAALQHMDTKFIEPRRVKVALVTSGDAQVDTHIRDTARTEGQDLNVGMAQN